MGQRTVRPARHDRRKRGVGAAPPHLVLELERRLALGPAGEPALRDDREHLVGERGRGADRVELAVVLHRPERLHQPSGGHQLGPVRREPAQSLVLAHRHREVLEAHAAREVGGRVLEQVLAALLAVEAVDLASGLGHVAEVGEEDPPARAHDARPVRACVSGQVADVDQVGDDERLELPLAQHRLEPVGPAHASP